MSFCENKQPKAPVDRLNINDVRQNFHIHLNSKGFYVPQYCQELHSWLHQIDAKLKQFGDESVPCFKKEHVENVTWTQGLPKPDILKNSFQVIPSLSRYVQLTSSFNGASEYYCSLANAITRGGFMKMRSDLQYEILKIKDEAKQMIGKKFDVEILKPASKILDGFQQNLKQGLKEFAEANITSSRSTKDFITEMVKSYCKATDTEEKIRLAKIIAMPKVDFKIDVNHKYTIVDNQTIKFVATFVRTQEQTPSKHCHYVVEYLPSDLANPKFTSETVKVKSYELKYFDQPCLVKDYCRQCKITNEPLPEVAGFQEQIKNLQQEKQKTEDLLKQEKQKTEDLLKQEKQKTEDLLKQEKQKNKQQYQDLLEKEKQKSEQQYQVLLKQELQKNEQKYQDWLKQEQQKSKQQYQTLVEQENLKHEQRCKILLKSLIVKENYEDIIFFKDEPWFSKEIESILSQLEPEIKEKCKVDLKEKGYITVSENEDDRNSSQNSQMSQNDQRFNTAFFGNGDNTFQIFDPLNVDQLKTLEQVFITKNQAAMKNYPKTPQFIAACNQLIQQQDHSIQNDWNDFLDACQISDTQNSYAEYCNFFEEYGQNTRQPAQQISNVPLDNVVSENISNKQKKFTRSPVEEGKNQTFAATKIGLKRARDCQSAMQSQLTVKRRKISDNKDQSGDIFNNMKLKIVKMMDKRGKYPAFRDIQKCVDSQITDEQIQQILDEYFCLAPKEDFKKIKNYQVEQWTMDYQLNNPNAQDLNMYIQQRLQEFNVLMHQTAIKLLQQMLIKNEIQGFDQICQIFHMLDSTVIKTIMEQMQQQQNEALILEDSNMKSPSQRYDESTNKT